MTIFRIVRSKPTVLFFIFMLSSLSFATILLMADLTSHIVQPGIHAHKKKSLHSIFTSQNSSATRGLLHQLSIYQSSSIHIKSAFPTFTCARPRYMDNSSARVQPDVSFVTLDRLSVETFGDYTPTVARLSRLANRMTRRLNKTAVLEERNQTIDEIIEEFGLMVGLDRYIYLPGGHWRPRNCAPKWKVAIVIPFRDRIGHLAIFLRHMIPFLQTQHLEFSIFVIEQNNNKSFNRAMLLNVGFLETLKLTQYDCFIFHDVDHLALNLNNYYGCDQMPRHFISGDDTWGYTIIYQELFGGVTGLTRKQMFKVNGFSNVFWGWGGEDDDLYQRIKKMGYTRTRPQGVVGFYNTIRHNHEQKEDNDDRHCLLHFSAQRMIDDGLSSLKYDEPVVELTPLFTKISVDIKELPWQDDWIKCGPLKALFNPDNAGFNLEPDNKGMLPYPPVDGVVPRKKQVSLNEHKDRPLPPKDPPLHSPDDAKPDNVVMNVAEFKPNTVYVDVRNESGHIQRFNCLKCGSSCPRECSGFS